MQSWPIFMPGQSVIGRLATLESSSVMWPENPGSTKPAGEGGGSPRRPSELLPSSRAAMSPGRVTTSSVEPSTNSPGCRTNGSPPPPPPPRVQDERLVAVRLDLGGEVVLLQGGVDVGVPGVVEYPEVPVQPDVDARGLHQPGVVGLEPEPPLGDRGLDVAIGQQHGAESR